MLPTNYRGDHAAEIIQTAPVNKLPTVPASVRMPIINEKTAAQRRAQ